MKTMLILLGLFLLWRTLRHPLFLRAVAGTRRESAPEKDDRRR